MNKRINKAQRNVMAMRDRLHGVNRQHCQQMLIDMQSPTQHSLWSAILANGYLTAGEAAAACGLSHSHAATQLQIMVIMGTVVRYWVDGCYEYHIRRDV